MTDKPENPPAFPNLRRRVGENLHEHISEGGMLLRDYFAAAALQGMIANMAEGERHDKLNGFTGFKLISEASYAAADSMLAARQGGEK